MAKERDTSDVSGTSQSKRPLLNRPDSSDQTHHLPHQHHRPKGQKHIVGGGMGGRLHARVPSSKALQKHHAATSSTKLNRRRSLSPDQATGPPLAPNHRCAPSDLKLGEDAPASSHIRKNSSHTSLKRNRSHVDVGKKSKSSTNLKRSQSNPAVHKLKAGASKVHFNLGDDGQGDFEDDGDGDGLEDEWVDASTSASPLLSRRSSTAAGAQMSSALPGPPKPSPTASDLKTTQLAAANHAHDLSQSANHSQANHNQYLTSRILQRTPSHGAPPKMTAENASVRPGSSRPHSPDSAIVNDTSSILGTPRMASQSRPGSSGKQELTSRFVGNNSQEPGSGVLVDHLMTSTQHGGISRAAANGRLEANGPRRPRSMGSLSQTANKHGANGDYSDYGRAVDSVKVEDEPLTDEEDGENNRLAAGPRARRNGGYTHTTADMSRTQQKLNLQRASSTLESAHPHPGIGMGLGGVAVAPGPLVGGSTYDSRDPRLGKLLERTGMEYLIVRRYQNPIARSLARLAQLPGADKNRPIPRPGTTHSKRASDVSGRPAPGQGVREREPRDPSMATLIGGQSTRRPTTPRGAFSSLRQPASASSSLETDDGASRMHDRQRLSGASLVNGEDDAGTLALLRNMWDKNLDLSASQD